ncbi:metallophosphoesterase [Arcticibacterium luteifluviistationis]|uniref:Metallophosphoesterase n=1 Tax=Arcticibacterium luteifluviistationis TaxID=1784714 RepID=A0A2Z4GE62_9BACT|nr:metallophosphoesterase [Arcticibacterium luteifluviistationis]AWV99431.1 metallophosphoesterase [Arcticibacterium luteifluviistationis]
MKIVTFIIGLLVSFSLMGQEITRGPFLQSARQDGLIIKWRSNAVQVFQLKYGLQESKLDSSKNITGFIDFEANLVGLSPATLYYYSITNSENKIVRGSFKTLPLASSTNKLSFVALGDCGTGTPAQKEVLKQVKNYYQDKPIDGMLLLGDNAYNFGFDREYQSNFFSVYQDDLLRKTVLWPTPGNHDYADRPWPNDFGERPDYFNIFKLPSEGESGGLTSNSEAYYSFDVGNVHFVSLDSYGQEDGQRMSNLLGKQAKWLQEDLTANKLEWTVVFFHHPPFSKGSHDSDKEQELIDIRTNLVPIFDKYGVDLVLTGHSHTYERSYLLNGFNGTEAEFDKEKHTISSSSAKYNQQENSCPYLKKDVGTVYMVAGTGGWVGGKSEGYPHDAMHFSDSDETGAVIIEVEDNVFTVKYLTSKGITLDNFVMVKSESTTENLSIACGETLTLKTNWSDNSLLKNYNPGLTTAPLFQDTLISISDTQGCLTQHFQVEVNQLPVPIANANSPILENQDLHLSSQASSDGILTWEGPNNFKSNEPNPTLKNVTTKEAGIYVLKEKIRGCVSETAIEVIINPVLKTETPLAMLIVSPNPSESRFKILFNPIKPATYNFQFYTLSGQLLYEETHDINSTAGFELAIDAQKIGINQRQIILKVSSESYNQSKLISTF